MKIRSASFYAAAASGEAFPRHGLPEVAFIGRSNVGKSSLINMVTGCASLARTGSRPGVTRAVNFFLVNDRIIFADLPGYGYAKTSATERRSISSLIREYLATRRQLRLALVLIDVRRKPEREERSILSLLLNRGVPIIILLTKADKCSRAACVRACAETARSLNLPAESVAAVSSKTGMGRRELLSCIEEFTGRCTIHRPLPETSA